MRTADTRRSAEAGPLSFASGDARARATP